MTFTVLIRYPPDRLNRVTILKYLLAKEKEKFDQDFWFDFMLKNVKGEPSQPDHQLHCILDRAAK